MTRKLTALTILGGFIILLVTMALAPPAFATDKYWFWSSSGGYWDAQAGYGQWYLANQSQTTKPVAGDNAFIGATQFSQNYIVNVRYAEACANLTFQANKLTYSPYTEYSSTLNINAGGTLTVSGNIADNVGIGYLNIAGGTLTLTGAGTTATVDNFNLTSGTLNMNGTGTFSKNITNGAGTVNINNTGGLTGTTISVSAFNVGNTAAGTFTLGSGQALSAASESLGTFNGTNTFTQNAGTNTVSGALTMGYGTYNLNGGTLSVGNLTNGTGTGTLSVAGGTLTLTGATASSVDTFNFTSGILNVNQSAAFSNSIDGGTSGTTINYNTTYSSALSGASIAAGTLNVGATAAGTFARSSGTVTVTNLNLAPTSGIAGAVSLFGGTWNVTNFTAGPGTATINGTGTINVSGNWTDAGIGNGSTNTINFNGSGTQLVNAAHNFVWFSHNGAGTLQLTGHGLSAAYGFSNSNGIYDANGLTTQVTGSAAVLSGSSTYLAKTAAQNFYAGLTLSGGTLTGDTGTINVDGPLTLNSGTLTAPSGAFTVAGNWANTSATFTPGTNTVDMDLATGTQTLDSGGTGTGKQFYNLTHSGAGTLQLLTNDLQVNGALTNSAGTLDANGKSITVGGNWANSATFTPSTGTVTMNGATGTQTLNSGGTGAGKQFNNLTHSGDGTLQLSTNDLQVNGNLQNSAGIFDTNAKNVSVGGTLGASGGTVNVTSGSTVTLSGATNTVTGGTLKVNGSLLGSAAGKTLTVSSGGTLTGSGTIGSNTVGVNTTINSGGILKPGNSPGLMTIYGNFSNLGNIEFELGGATTRGTDYDAINVTNGTAVLGGVFQLKPWNGYTPTLGTVFTLIQSTGAMTYDTTPATLDTSAFTGLSGMFTGAIVGNTYRVTYDVASYLWNDGTGNWTTDTAKWTPAGPPTASNDVTINNVSAVVSVTANANANNLTIGNGSLNLTGGTLAVAGDVVNTTGTGTINVDGGTLSVTGANIAADSFNVGNAAAGAFTLTTGKTLTAPTENIGGAAAGTFTHTAGTNAVTTLNVGTGAGTGQYDFNGGTISSLTGLYVGKSGTGTFNQNASITTPANFYVGYNNGSNGNYNLNSGTLTASYEYIGNVSGSSGTFTQSGGINNATNIYTPYNGGTGTYHLNGGTLNVSGAYTQYANGNFDMASGSIMTTGTLAINGGTFNQTNSAGSLTTGTYNQTGGTFNNPIGGMILNPVTSGTVFSKTSGTFNANGRDIAFKAGTSGYMNINPGTGTTFAGVTFDKGSTITNNDWWMFPNSVNDVVMDGTLNIKNSNTAWATANNVVGYGVANTKFAVRDNLWFESTPSATGTAVLGSATASENVTVKLGGNFLMEDANAVSYADIQFTGAGNAQTVTKSNGAISGGNWTVNKTTGGTVSQASALSLPSTLSINNGTWYTNGNALSVTGAFTNDGTFKMNGNEALTFTKDTNSGIVEYVGHAGTGMNYGNTYYDLKVNSTSGTNTFSPNAALTVNNNLDVLSGTLNTAGQNVSVGGTTTVSGGTFAVNSTMTGSGVVNVSSGGTLQGSGTLTGLATAINSGGILNPGNSPGTMTIDGGSLTWAPGGTAIFEIRDATGVAGTDWDLIRLINGATLNITATPTDKFNIIVRGLDPNTGLPGDPANYLPTIEYNWLFVDTPSVNITGFDPGSFNFTTEGFPSGGVFALKLGSITMNANPQTPPVPEIPMGLMLPLLALLGGAMILLKKKFFGVK